jgi:hypothetical protein
MVVDSAPTEDTDVKTRVYQVVTQHRITSLEMIAQRAGLDEDATRVALQELVEDGSLTGVVSDDGMRFFMSDVRTSKAPVALKHEEYEIEKADTKLGKSVFIAGIVTMIAGYVVRGFVGIQPILEHVGSGILFIGMAVLVAGWLQVSRSMPPEELRKP